MGMDDRIREIRDLAFPENRAGDSTPIEVDPAVLRGLFMRYDGVKNALGTFSRYKSLIRWFEWCYENDESPVDDSGSYLRMVNHASGLRSTHFRKVPGAVRNFHTQMMGWTEQEVDEAFPRAILGRPEGFNGFKSDMPDSTPTPITDEEPNP